MRICLLQPKKFPQNQRGMSLSALPTIIVPARLASVRFPRKLLADAGGKPLILRTAERIREQVPEFEIIFAVDGEELATPLRDGGFESLLTDPNLPSGTDRIAQANQTLRRPTVINVQADEPMVEREHILALAEALRKEEASMATLAVRFHRTEDFLDPDQVKVVLDGNGYALYFSRAPIPHLRDGIGESHDMEESAALKHLGMYAYKSSFLKTYAERGQGVLEKIEKLEQLRALEFGYRIAVSIVSKATIGVDKPEDLESLSFS